MKCKIIGLKIINVHSARKNYEESNMAGNYMTKIPNGDCKITPGRMTETKLNDCIVGVFTLAETLITLCICNYLFVQLFLNLVDNPSTKTKTK